MPSHTHNGPHLAEEQQRHHHHRHGASMRRLTAAQYARLPKALPCTNYYDIYPEDAGPTGTVVIKCQEEMKVWALVATPVPKAEACQREGGYIEYLTGDPKNPVQYYHFHHSSDCVFGRAAYLQRPVRGTVVSTPSG